MHFAEREYRRPLRRKVRLLPVLLVAAATLLSACGALERKPQPLDVVVLHTNDTLGFTRPAT